MKDISKDIGEEIILKLKVLEEFLRKVRMEKMHNEKELPTTFVSGNRPSWNPAERRAGEWCVYLRDVQAKTKTEFKTEKDRDSTWEYQF